MSTGQTHTATHMIERTGTTTRVHMRQTTATATTTIITIMITTMDMTTRTATRIAMSTRPGFTIRSTRRNSTSAGSRAFELH